mgnify:CR=1 FL=1
MKNIKNKWNGTKLTINYFGSFNNKFGIGKKRIILEEDKLEPLYKNPGGNYLLTHRTKKNNPYFKNLLLNGTKNNKEKNNFEYIKINDWEKTNNYNFYNYIKNMKYFNRVNNYKRILSFKKLNIKNNRSLFFFENEFSKNRHISFSSKRKKKPVLLTGNNLSQRGKNIEQMSRNNISNIISNYISYKNKSCIKKMSINVKDNIIRKNIPNTLLKVKINSRNKKKINKIFTNNYIFNNQQNSNKNLFHNLQNKYFKIDKKKVNDIEKERKSLSPKISYNSQKAFSFFQKQNIKKDRNIMTPDTKNKNKTVKISGLCDVATNTDF